MIQKQSKEIQKTQIFLSSQGFANYNIHPAITIQQNSKFRPDTECTMEMQACERGKGLFAVTDDTGQDMGWCCYIAIASASMIR